jgi:hypothetical protein
VGLDEGRSGSREPGFVVQGDVGRLPPGTSAYAGRMLERCEEFVPQERIAIAPERIPLPRVELVDAVVETRPWERWCQECFSMSKASR